MRERVGNLYLNRNFVYAAIKLERNLLVVIFLLLLLSIISNSLYTRHEWDVLKHVVVFTSSLGAVGSFLVFLFVSVLEKEKVAQHWRTLHMAACIFIVSWGFLIPAINGYEETWCEVTRRNVVTIMPNVWHIRPFGIFLMTFPRVFHAELIFYPRMFFLNQQNAFTASNSGVCAFQGW